MPVVRPYPIDEFWPQSIAGEQRGQTGGSLAAFYERTAREANDTRVQDLNNRFITGRREILQTGPDAYYNQTGADAITGADAATGRLMALRDEIFGQAANGYQRRKLAPILDTHLAASSTGITRHAVAQQEVYGRGVAASAIETSRAEALADPAMMANAVMRAEGAARVLHAGQPPDAVESGVRAAGGSVIAGVIGERLSRDDPQGVVLFRQYADRLDPSARHALGMAAGTLSTSLDAAAWVRDRSATLRTRAPSGDAALDAVNAASAPLAEPPPAVSSGGLLRDEGDGVVGTRERLAEIDQHRRALTALNQQEFAADPARLHANQVAIDTDTVRRRAAVKTDIDTLYAALRRHLTTGGPDGGPAVTLPPATIMSRLTDAQQEAVRAQVDAAIEGRTTGTDPQTWHAIRQGLTGDDAGERQRWASASLVPFMGRLSAEDYAALEKLQSVVRTNAGGAEQRRLQAVARMADGALRSIGIDPTPRPDAIPGSDAAQAAMFHRAVQDELSAVESRGRPPTEAEAYGIVTGLKDTGLASGWLKVRDTSPTVMSDIPPTDDALHEPGAQIAQAGPASPPGQGPLTVIGLAAGPEQLERQREEYERYRAAEQAAAGTGGFNGAPGTEPVPGSPDYRDADIEARAIVAEQDAEEAGGRNGAPLTEPAPGSPDYRVAETEARRIADRQDADEREADRMTTRWLAQRRDSGSSPKLSPVLADRLSPAEREELEALAAKPDTPTDPEAYNRILSNLLNYNSQVRLKWAREPLFRYRKSLSAEDFARLARLQSRLDPETGQVSGFAPVPTDLAPLYDWLAPEPDWDYGTFVAIKGTGKDKDWRFVLPSPVRSFFKGMLDLFAAEKTGELTTDALESFMTLHGLGGRAFGPRGGAGTLAAGGKRVAAPPPRRVGEADVPGASNAVAVARSAKTAENGPGVWRIVNEEMSERAAAYQTQITGRPANESYTVKGVKFDGYSAGMLLDAKGPGYAQWVVVAFELERRDPKALPTEIRQYSVEEYIDSIGSGLFGKNCASPWSWRGKTSVAERRNAMVGDKRPAWLGNLEGARPVCQRLEPESRYDP